VSVDDQAEDLSFATEGTSCLRVAWVQAAMAYWAVPVVRVYWQCMVIQPPRVLKVVLGQPTLLAGMSFGRMLIFGSHWIYDPDSNPYFYCPQHVIPVSTLRAIMYADLIPNLYLFPGHERWAKRAVI